MNAVAIVAILVGVAANLVSLYQHRVIRRLRAALDISREQNDRLLRGRRGSAS